MYHNICSIIKVFKQTATENKPTLKLSHFQLYVLLNIGELLSLSDKTTSVSSLCL